MEIVEDDLVERIEEILRGVQERRDAGVGRESHRGRGSEKRLIEAFEDLIEEGAMETEDVQIAVVDVQRARPVGLGATAVQLEELSALGDDAGDVGRVLRTQRAPTGRGQQIVSDNLFGDGRSGEGRRVLGMVKREEEKRAHSIFRNVVDEVAHDLVPTGRNVSKDLTKFVR
jgi:hypothetical protein